MSPFVKDLRENSILPWSHGQWGSSEWGLGAGYSAGPSAATAALWKDEAVMLIPPQLLMHLKTASEQQVALWHFHVQSVTTDTTILHTQECRAVLLMCVFLIVYKEANLSPAMYDQSWLLMGTCRIDVGCHRHKTPTLPSPGHNRTGG